MIHRYVHYKLTEGVWGVSPGATITERGGALEVSWGADGGGYRVGVLREDADLTGLEDWDLSEITGAEALAFHAGFYPDTYAQDDGRFYHPPPPE